MPTVFSKNAFGKVFIKKFGVVLESLAVHTDGRMTCWRAALRKGIWGSV